MTNNVVNVIDKILFRTLIVILESLFYIFFLFFEAIWLSLRGRDRDIDLDKINHHFLKLITTLVSCVVAIFVGLHLPWWWYFVAGVFTVIWEDLLGDVFIIIQNILEERYDVEINVVQTMEVVETSVITCIVTSMVMRG